MRRRKDINILLVNNNQTEVHCFKNLFGLVSSNVKVHIQKSISDAFKYLIIGCQFIAFPIPDLILIDAELLKADGEFLLRIRSNRRLKDIPLVILTAFENLHVYLPEMELSSVTFVSKPFDNKKLSEIIRKHFDIPKARSKYTPVH
ncbi:MAG: two-component system response regulator [Ignavibacteriales bacterium]